MTFDVFGDVLIDVGVVTPIVLGSVVTRVVNTRVLGPSRSN